MVDDLTQLPGIGAASAKVFAKAGLLSFAAIAALAPDTLAERLQTAGGLKGKPDLAAIATAARNAATIDRGPEEPSSNGALAPTEGASKPARADDGARADGLTAITVTGPRRGRWRGGRFFTPEPLTFAATADELVVIAADPRLSWQPAG